MKNLAQLGIQPGRRARGPSQCRVDRLPIAHASRLAVGTSTWLWSGSAELRGAQKGERRSEPTWTAFAYVCDARARGR
jgi:hypothetical protein